MALLRDTMLFGAIVLCAAGCKARQGAGAASGLRESVPPSVLPAGESRSFLGQSEKDGAFWAAEIPADASVVQLTVFRSGQPLDPQPTVLTCGQGTCSGTSGSNTFSLVINDLEATLTVASPGAAADNVQMTHTVPDGMMDTSVAAETRYYDATLRDGSKWAVTYATGADSAGVSVLDDDIQLLTMRCNPVAQTCKARFKNRDVVANFAGASPTLTIQGERPIPMTNAEEPQWSNADAGALEASVAAFQFSGAVGDAKFKFSYMPGSPKAELTNRRLGTVQLSCGGSSRYVCNAKLAPDSFVRVAYAGGALAVIELTIESWSGAGYLYRVF